MAGYRSDHAAIAATIRRAASQAGSAVDGDVLVAMTCNGYCGRTKAVIRESIARMVADGELGEVKLLVPAVDARYRRHDRGPISYRSAVGYELTPARKGGEA